MRTLFRMTLLGVVSLAGALASPGVASAQEEASADTTTTSEWEVLVRPRLGVFLPKWDYAEGRGLPRRPSAGMEAVVRRKDSWWGGRILYDRTSAWGSTDLPGWPDGSPRPDHFETVVGNAILYPFPGHQTLPYFFGGIGSKALSLAVETGIFPYSFSGSERSMTWHGGFGVEVPLEGTHAILEVGDYYGRSGERGNVHEIHVTFLVGLPGIGDLVRGLGGNRSEGPD